MKNTIQILPANGSDYAVIQNMARFYTYDLSRQCGFLSSDWALPEDGLYRCFDLKIYFEDDTRRAYLVKVDQELAGFVLLKQMTSDVKVDWNMAEFFILAKFQGKGVGSYVAQAIWDQYPGNWEMAVIPENCSALAFWHKTIGHYMSEHYYFATKLVRSGQAQPYRVIFTFDTRLKTKKTPGLTWIPKLTGLNHITLAVRDIEKSFTFYCDLLDFQPLVKWHKGAYFLVNDLWFCLNEDEKRSHQACYTHYAFTVSPQQFAIVVERLLAAGIIQFQDNRSEGDSFYFLDPDGHKLEIHVGNWRSRIQSKQQDPGSWKQIKWFIS